MVDYVADANELARRIRAWSFSIGGDTELKNRIQLIPGVTADLICEAAEILYAHNDILDDDAKRIMAELFNYTDNQGWTTFNKENRSKTIVKLAAFDLGDTITKPIEKPPQPEANRRDGLDWRETEVKETQPTQVEPK